jgi:predicted nucleic acid-binding protein
VSVVADAGPLIALAKIDGLSALLDLHPHILICPAVHNEAVTVGLTLGAEDAMRLRDEYEAGRLELRAPTLPELPVPARLGAGETDSIRLAIDLRADWLLVDDLEARRAAQQSFEAVSLSTAIQGTLGVITASCSAGHISRDKAVELVQAIKGRPDIWISAELCDRVISGLKELA